MVDSLMEYHLQETKNPIESKLTAQTKLLSTIYGMDAIIWGVGVI